MWRSFYVALFTGLVEFSLMESAYAIPQCTAPAVAYQTGKKVYVASQMGATPCGLISGAQGSVPQQNFSTSASTALLPRKIPTGACYAALVGTLGTTLKYNQGYSGQFIVNANNDLTCFSLFSFLTTKTTLTRGKFTSKRTSMQWNSSNNGGTLSWSSPNGDYSKNITYTATILPITHSETIYVNEGTTTATLNNLQTTPDTSYAISIVAIDPGATNSGKLILHTTIQIN